MKLKKIKSCSPEWTARQIRILLEKKKNQEDTYPEKIKDEFRDEKDENPDMGESFNAITQQSGEYFSNLTKKEKAFLCRELSDIFQIEFTSESREVEINNEFYNLTPYITIGNGTMSERFLYQLPGELFRATLMQKVLDNIPGSYDRLKNLAEESPYLFEEEE